MKFGAIVLTLLGVPAFATVADPRQIQQQLQSANLVADVQVESLGAVSDVEFGARSRASLRVLRIYQIVDDGGWFPQEGESITLETLGGEVGESGIHYSGYPRPYNGRRYHASLVRQSGAVFRVTGLDLGLTPLERTRSYSRNRTDGSNGTGTGAYLYWDAKYFPIPYFISLPTFQNQQEFVSQIDLSFAPWRAPGDVTMEFIPMGCTSTTLNRNDGINAVILVSDAWNFEPTAIAITRNFYVSGVGPRSGQILDTDIMINAVDHAFTTTGDPTKNDVRNIITHEVGHFIGLGHEANPQDTLATMYPSALPGETNKRNLHRSDLAGLHAAYGGVGQKFAAFSSNAACSLGAQKMGCASVHGGPRRSAVYAWVGIALALALGLGHGLRLRFGH